MSAPEDTIAGKGFTIGPAYARQMTTAEKLEELFGTPATEDSFTITLRGTPGEPFSALLDAMRSVGATAQVLVALRNMMASGELMTKAAHEAAVEQAVRDADQNRTREEDELD